MVIPIDAVTGDMAEVTDILTDAAAHIHITMDEAAATDTGKKLEGLCWCHSPSRIHNNNEIFSFCAA